VAAGLLLVPLGVRAADVLPPPGGPIYEAIVLDADTGQVLRELNADTVTYPASLTKMMTLYLTFEALNSGRLRLDQYFAVSFDAATHKPSKLGLKPGETISVRDLILGVVTRSANDAAAVLAEGLGGSEANFALLMTRKAHQLGMTRTQYHNASGLPDPGQLTTARDMARLALALYRDFPREYRYFAVREFEFRGATIPSHDHLLEWYDGADGIKTGYTVASGFNLASSAVRSGRRLIGVILGGGSARSRDEEMGRLLDLGFADLARPSGAPLPTLQVAAASPAPAAAAAPVVTAAPVVQSPGPVREPQAKAQPVVAESPVVARTRARAAAATEEGDGSAPPARERARAAATEAAETAPEVWSIQVGTFRGAGAAEEAARKIARLAVARGKPEQILPPAHREHPKVYRVRFARFSSQQAQAACEVVRKKRMACAVVRSTGVHVAAR
jgi:D-alanyl-D-alanine carboxypeptidase